MTVPPVSFALYEADFERFARELGASLERYGFAVLAGHDVPQPVIARVEAAARAFFALPDEVKRRWVVPGGAGQRGYTPFGLEIAKGAEHHDLKEFWHVGREPAPPRLARNVWPDAPAGFRDDLLSLYAALDGLGARVLRAVARHLGLDGTFFEGPTRGGDSILRLLHYPPVPEGVGAGHVRAGAHEDIDVLTLLLGAEEAGLELRDRDGRWLAVNPPPGAIVVNIGDMLQRLTHGVLPSTSHRVINPSAERRGVARYSTPFFLHFAPDYLIEPLPGCIGRAGTGPTASPITAGDFLRERLRAIGLA